MPKADHQYLKLYFRSYYSGYGIQSERADYFLEQFENSNILEILVRYF